MLVYSRNISVKKNTDFWSGVILMSCLCSDATEWFSCCCERVSLRRSPAALVIWECQSLEKGQTQNCLETAFQVHVWEQLKGNEENTSHCALEPTHNDEVRRFNFMIRVHSLSLLVYINIILIFSLRVFHRRSEEEVDMDKVTAAMVLTSLSTSPLVRSPPVKVSGEHHNCWMSC